MLQLAQLVLVLSSCMLSHARHLVPLEAIYPQINASIAHSRVLPAQVLISVQLVKRIITFIIMLATAAVQRRLVE